MTYRPDKKLIALFLLILFPLITLPLRGQRTKSSLSAGEQRFAEKGLKDNRYFFYFIDTSVTNLGDNEQQKIFKESIQRDMIAQILYMKFSFSDSFKEVRHSQKLLINLYQKTLTKDIAITLKLLNSFAPEVINTKNRKARHYLSLGYRDVAVARQYLLMADNYRQSLYSMRLYKYAKAIKKAKHGKRYAFMAILESRQVRESPFTIEKEIQKLYQEMHEYTEESKIKAYRKKIKLRKKDLLLARSDLGYLSFEKFAELIKTIDKNKKNYYVMLHHDNFYRTIQKKSFFDRTWENPRLDEIKEYKKYQEKY